MPVLSGIEWASGGEQLANPFNGAVVDKLMAYALFVARVDHSVERVRRRRHERGRSQCSISKVECPIVLLVQDRRDGAQHVLLEALKVPGRVASRANSLI